MSEEKAQQLLSQMQMLETYLTELANKEQSIIGILQEAAAAVESIKSINEQPESETLVPMGMGSFVKAKISSKDKIILNLGAGVAMEKDKDSAINFLEARIKEMQVALQNTTAQKHQVYASLEKGKEEMNKLIQASRSKQQ